MIDSFHSSGNSSFFKRELISLCISERIVLKPLYSILPGFDQYLVIFTFLIFPIAVSNSKALGSVTSVPVVRIDVSLTSLTPCKFNN